MPIAKPTMWYPGVDVLHPLCPDFAWNFWEGAGSKVGCVGKRVGRPGQYDGTLTNGPTWVGQGVRVTLLNQAITTVAFPALTSGTLLINLDNHTRARDYSYWISAGTSYVRISNNDITMSYVLDGTTIYNNVVGSIFGVHTAVLSWNGVNAKAWVDGRLLATVATVKGMASCTLLFGNRDALNLGIDGTIFAGSIYNRALIPSEIQQLYADPFAAHRPRRRVFPVAVGVAPTSVLSGPLVGCLGGPV